MLVPDEQDSDHEMVEAELDFDDEDLTLSYPAGEPSIVEESANDMFQEYLMFDSIAPTATGFPS